MRIYNTMSKEVEKFIPIQEGRVKMYTCGPTVYNYAHIGNLRTYIFEDVLKRVLEYNDYDVNHVMNITDVGHLQSDADDGEDKMKLGAEREKKSVLEVARYYEKAFLSDLEKLNILMPNTLSRATDHVQDMISLIGTLEEKGYTYTANQNVYFSIDKFADYSKLANLSMDDLLAGSRIEVDESKKNPLDFVLWFGNSKYENHILKWDSPWGPGFPGWHVECSAMAMKYLGDSMDIHCGGVDHIPVHHTNEIAQSEAATGKKWVNYWIHGEFLVLEDGKMSKSKGEFLTLERIIEKGIDPLVYRYYVLQSKYSKPLAFSYERMEDAKRSFSQLKQRVLKIGESVEDVHIIDKSRLSPYRQDFKAHVSDDLNIANAFTVLFDVIKDDSLNPLEKKSLIEEFDLVFGLKLTSIEKIDSEKTKWIESMIQKRNEARAQKDWKTSDLIRDLLSDEGIEILDGRDGTKWSIKA